MFRELRRKNQALPRGECLDILQRSANGVLALLGDGGYPYAVPLNHVCIGEKLYFHCAMEGHKIDAVRACDRASYCVTDADEVDAQAYSTRYRSVIAFGRMRILEDEGEKINILSALGGRFCPATPERTAMEIRGAADHTAVLELSIEHISGKEAAALVQERRA